MHRMDDDFEIGQEDYTLPPSSLQFSEYENKEEVSVWDLDSCVVSAALLTPSYNFLVHCLDEYGNLEQKNTDNETNGSYI
jgi:hypothetical protein